MTEISPLSVNQRVFDNWLYQQYPTVFKLKHPIPLAIGIGEELLKQLPDNVKPADLKSAMAWYCHRTCYQKAMLKHTQRINLQGELVGEVKEQDKKVAQDRFDRIQKKYAKPKETSPSDETPIESIPKPEIIEMIEVTEPMQPTEEVKEEIKPKKLVLKRKTVEPIAEAIIEPVAEVTPVKAESKPTPVKAPSSNVAVAKGLKVTLVVEPASIPIIDSTGKKTVTLTIQVANTDIKVTTSLSSKSYRKAMNSIEEFGVDGCNAIIQGSMKKYGVIEDAGLVIQPKKAAASEPEAV
jgi:sRNA-binding protein